MAEHSSRRAASLIGKEEAHRRLLLLGIAVLLILSVAPIFGHHFATRIEHGFQGQDHLGALCLIALHEILQPFHRFFHFLIAGGLAYALYDRVRATMRTRAVLVALAARQATPGDAFSTAATAVGLDPARLRIASGLPNPAFTIGWIRPRVYVAESVAARLAPAELEALLAHEGAHVARRDPLRLSALRFLALLLFWIPALRRLATDVADEAEIQADDVAAGARPLALASALLTLAQWPRPTSDLPDVVGFSHAARLLDRRIRRLAGESPRPRMSVTRRSIAGAFLALSLVTISGVVMVHPLPVDATTHRLAHCDHQESAFLHLFCHMGIARAQGVPCPHGRSTG